MKAPIKWAGGKSRLINKINHYLPPNCHNYYEPFCGSGSVFLNVNLKTSSIVADINIQIINLFEQIKTHPKSLIKRLKRLQKRNNSKSYAKYREKFNKVKNRKGLLPASLFVYLNKAGYAGIYRENLSGNFNVPFGKYPKINCVSNIREISKFLKENDIKFSCCDWKETLKNTQKGDFVYLDPPYHKETKTSFTKYSSSDFGEKEQKELAKTLKKLDKDGVMWMMSNSNTTFINSLYRKFHIIKLYIGKHINNYVPSRQTTKKDNEVLIMNYNPILCDCKDWIMGTHIEKDERKWGIEICEKYGIKYTPKMWSGKLGEYLFQELWLFNHKKKIWKPSSKYGLRPDFETKKKIYEIKTRTWQTSGTAGELGVPFKYAEIPEIFAKPLVIVLVGGYQEKEAVEKFGLFNTKIKNKNKQLKLWKKQKISFVLCSDYYTKLNT